MRLRHALARAAAVLLAVPAPFAFALPAQADPIEVPGCYGVAVVVCDPAIDIVLPVGLEPWSTTIPVCAGTCQDVPVNAYTVGTNSDPQACVKTEDRSGNESRSCVPLSLGALPNYRAVSCGSSDYVGRRIVDENGSTVVDACVYVGQITVPNYSVELCGSGYVGARVYDEWGSQVAGQCVRLPRTNIEELCWDLNDALAPWGTLELNCQIVS